MSVLKRLIPYILLNILISAATTWAVLSWWNNSHSAAAPLPTQAALPQPTQALATTQNQQPIAPTNTPQPAGTRLVEIAEVSGAGNLGTEMVLIRRVGEGELRLSGWSLDDNAGHRFPFPDIVLNKGGSVRVYSRSGTNSVNELYWNLKEAAWTPGKNATLYDEQGNVRAVFVIPSR